MDYHQLLVRAVSALASNDAESRGAIYERARHAVARAPLTISEIGQERFALEAAIQKIEAEIVGTGVVSVPSPDAAAQVPDEVPDKERIVRPRGSVAQVSEEVPDEVPDKDRIARPRGSVAAPMKTHRLAHLLVAGLAAAAMLAAGSAGYHYWRKPAAENAQPVQAPARSAARAAAAADDGRSYIFKRQFVYYRSIYPAGTIVVTKSQNFLYLVRPNNAALRYTIAVGRECQNVVGLLLVSAKEDWSGPQREAAKSDVPPISSTAGGRFGARSLVLSDTGHRIHGSDEPAAGKVTGCVPLLNEDVIDLYERVAMGARVVMN
jgi:lipoprotein-anchoring transpeptidase ErfK/SrfK